MNAADWASLSNLGTNFEVDRMASLHGCCWEWGFLRRLLVHSLRWDLGIEYPNYLQQEGLESLVDVVAEIPGGLNLIIIL